MGIVGVVRSRYAPARDHETSRGWLSLINNHQHQLREDNILLDILNKNPDFFVNNRGFDSSERDFDGFQHPFFYVSRQKQQHEVEEPRGPFVFSRIGGDGPLDTKKAILVDIPFRHRRIGDKDDVATNLGGGDGVATVPRSSE